MRIKLETAHTLLNEKSLILIQIQKTVLKVYSWSEICMREICITARIPNAIAHDRVIIIIAKIYSNTKTT